MKVRTLILLMVAMQAPLAVPVQAASNTILRVTAAWTHLHQTPSEKAVSVGLAFGNDTLTVLDQKGEWYKVITPANRSGWVSQSAILPDSGALAPVRLPAKALGYAQGLGAAGRSDMARERLFDLVRNYPGSLEAYEAVRKLAVYYNTELNSGEAPLPPPAGNKVALEDKVRAEAMVGPLLLAHGNELLRQGKHMESAKVFEEARVRGAEPERALDGLHQALLANLEGAIKGGRATSSAVTAALLAYKGYFPNKPLPTRLEGKLNPEAQVRYADPTPEAPQKKVRRKPGAAKVKG